MLVLSLITVLTLTYLWARSGLWDVVDQKVGAIELVIRDSPNCAEFYLHSLHDDRLVMTFRDYDTALVWFQESKCMEFIVVTWSFYRV